MLGGKIVWIGREEYVGSERKTHHAMERAVGKSVLKFGLEQGIFHEEILTIGGFANGCS